MTDHYGWTSIIANKFWTYLGKNYPPPQKFGKIVSQSCVKLMGVFGSGKDHYCDFRNFVDFSPDRHTKNPTPSKNRSGDNFRVHPTITFLCAVLSVEIFAPCLELFHNLKECLFKPLVAVSWVTRGCSS